MTLKREDIKKLVIQQMLLESTLNEESAVSKWFNTMRSKFAGSGKDTPPSSASVSKNPNRKIEGVADFLQQAQRSKELTALVSNTKVGQAAGFKPEGAQKPVEEALGMNLVSQIRKAGITDADLDQFIDEMSKNATAKKILAGLGLTSQDAPQAQQGQQTQQPQAAQASTSPEQTAQQTRKDKASQVAQSANKGQAQAPDKKNLQAVINKVRNPQKDSNQILAKQPIMARLSAAGFTPQQAKFVSDEFIKFLKTKVSKTAKGPQIKVLEQDQSAQQGHNNLRVFDNSSRSVMGQLVALMKKAIQDPKLGKSAKPINDTGIAGLAKELAKDIANQARVAAGLSIDSKDAVKQASSATAKSSTVGSKSEITQDNTSKKEIIFSQLSPEDREEVKDIADRVAQHDERFLQAYKNYDENPSDDNKKQLIDIAFKIREEVAEKYINTSRSEREEEAKQSGGRLGESLKEILIQEIYNALTGKTNE